MKRTLLILAGAIGLAHAAAGANDATATWPQFRGANAAGVAADAKPPEKFGPTEAVVWRVAVPWSPSSPCVWGDRIFLTTFNEGKLEVRCHNRADGALRWAHGIKPESIEDHHGL